MLAAYLHAMYAIRLRDLSLFVYTSVRSVLASSLPAGMLVVALNAITYKRPGVVRLFPRQSLSMETT